MIPLLLRVFYRPSLNRHFREVLVGSARSEAGAEESMFTAAECKLVLRDIWGRYSRHSGVVPQVSNMGGRINLQLACLTLCAFQSLLERGIERAHAIKIVADVTWKAYQRWGAFAYFISRLLAKDRVKRIRIATKAFQVFPFSPPAYKIERINQPGGVDLNVRRCVVAEYFKSNDAIDLCSGSWCDLDFALAELWGGQLERTQTLVNGNDICDFRFRAGSTACEGDVQPEKG